jgi:hypothetical protein
MFCSNLPETLYHRSLFPADSRRKNPQIGADLAIFCSNLPETLYHRNLFPADSRRKNPQIGADLEIFCVNLVRHEACVKYTTYVDARTTRAKMPISLKEVRLIWRKRKIKSSH